jgi:hypothetical protein
MSTHRDVDPATLERLLAVHPTVGGPDRLSGLLAAAAAPVRPGELTGEQAALVAFREAHPAGSPATRRDSMLKLAAAKLLTVKAAAIAAVAVTAAGGAALAATGNMPNPVAGLGSAPAEAAPTALPTPASAGNHGEADPSPSLEGLCEAYLAGATDNEGVALETPAFQALVAAAGSEDGVEEYCAVLVPDAVPEQAQPGAGPTERPTPTDLPTVVPTAVPGPGDHGPPQDGITPPDQR